jgi:hypothetical protein
MFNSTVLDVAAGLVLVFLAVSLITATITEALASILKWRASTLLRGVEELLNDSNASGLAGELYKHALVNPRADGTAKTATALKTLPAYIDPKHFADALMDITGIANAPNVTNAINQIADPQIKQLLTGIEKRAAGNVDVIRDQLASWFDSSMDRVSGVYKRRAQLVSFIVAFIIVFMLNLDTITLARELWRQPLLARTIAPVANQSPAEALQQLDGLRLPIGWTKTREDELSGPRSQVKFFVLAGWLLTAISTLFGAPFWFDTLQQFVRLKGSGPSPAEKRTGAAAAN